MNCRCPEHVISKPSIWSRLRPKYENEVMMRRANHFSKSCGHPHQATDGITPTDHRGLPMYAINFNRHLIQRRHSINDVICFQQNITRNEHVHVKKRNPFSLGPSKSMPGCGSNPFSFYHVTNASSTPGFHNKKENYSPTYTKSGTISKLSLNRQSSSTIWSDLDDAVFSDDNDDAVVNSHDRDVFREDCIITSLVSSARESQPQQQHKSMLNQFPIKGILKSSSQSSYSSFTNENSSDGETPTSENSQKSAESSSIGSKTSSKKRVHFEERVITKIILPSGAYTYYNDMVFRDTGPLLAMNNVNTQPDCNRVYSNDDSLIKTTSDHRNNNLEHNQTDNNNNKPFGNYSAYTSNEVKIKCEIVDGELRYGEGKSATRINYDKSHDIDRDEVEITLFPSYICPTKNVQRACIRDLTSSRHFSPQDSKFGEVVERNPNANRGGIAGNENVMKMDECRTAFPYRPNSSSKSSDIQDLSTTTSGEMPANRSKMVSSSGALLKQTNPNNGPWGRDNSRHTWSRTTFNTAEDEQPVEFPRVKFLQAQSPSPEEKTTRILEWLNDVKANRRARSRSNSVSLLMLPRPALFRRQSFVGE